MSEPVFSLLLADDEPDIISSIKRFFRKENYSIYTALNGKEAIAVLNEVDIDAAIIDLKMPGISGIELLEEIKKEHPSVEVIILTAFGAVEEAVKAMKLGAADFFEKPVKKESLLALIEHIETIRRLERENQQLKEQIDFSFGFDRLVGNSPPMIKLKKLIKQVGPSDSSVLVLGETGTGKELIAQALHKNSRRGDAPFVPVDCAAISESVMESELFGHVKGAFTGAQNASPGLIRSAHNGTVFFDEIGELPTHVQAKLLRTLQEKEVRPIGSSRTYTVDTRIIAATNRDLKTEVQKGNFREDLFYRLNVISLQAPPLRERKDDIPILIKYFLKKFALGDTVYHIKRPALELLSHYEWPGNVRELENSIRCLIAFVQEDTISERDILEHLEIVPEVEENKKRQLGAEDMETEGSSLSAYEKAAIINALSKTGGRRKEAAELLGIGEATLYRKIKTYALRKTTFENHF